MKYVMFQDKNNRRIPIIFPDFMVHADIDKIIQPLLEVAYKLDPVKAVSAGQCIIDCIDVHGNSSTLKLKATAGDDKVISMYDYQHGLL